MVASLWWHPAEMDLGEAHRGGLRTTSHPTTDIGRGAAEPWTGGAVNCYFPLAEDVGMYKDKDGNCSTAASPRTRSVPSCAWNRRALLHTWNIPGTGAAPWTDPGSLCACAAARDADHTNLVYCGFGKAGAINFETKKQSWVDHFGNAAYMTSSAAVPGCDSAPYTSCKYGPGAEYSIDTSRPYDVNVSFGWDAAAKTLNEFTVTLHQDAHAITMKRPVSNNPATVPLAGGFGADGKMGLLAQLWTSPDMSWLAGPGCKDTNPDSELPAVKDAQYTISDLRINSELVHFQTKPPPS